MKKRYCLVFCLFILCRWCIGQDAKDWEGKKTLIAFEAGGSFKGFFGQRYIEPTPEPDKDAYMQNRYERFTKMPAYGFGFGVRFAFKISDHLRLATGISYYFRKTIYENSQDTVIAYGYYTNMNFLRNVFTYNYANNNIEVPFLLQYKLDRITIYGGINLSLLSYRSATYKYMVYLSGDSTYWNTSQKIFTCFETGFRIYPALKVSYDVRIKKTMVQPFMGIELCEVNLKELYYNIIKKKPYTSPNVPVVENCFSIQAGVIFPLAY
jgi:hypothetical protein